MNIQDLYPHISFQKAWQINDKTHFMLGQCESIIKIISNIPIRPEYRNKLFSVAFIKGAKATTAIEGNTLSEEEVAIIEKGGKLPPSKEYLEIEVKNVLEALGKIRSETIFDKKTSFITPELIESFHYNVTKNLGDHCKAIPGKFRSSGHDVAVGYYSAPKGEHVKELIIAFCEWLKEEFKYKSGEQSFSDRIIQAIVSHVHIVCIHPFGDGNGRTARLVEFYILLRAGLPDIASHILSNYYNDTREEYYRQLDIVVKKRTLTGFIDYAILGFRDGLNEVLNIIQINLLKTSWQNYIYEILDSKKVAGKTKAVVKRRRTLALNFPVDRFYSIENLLNTEPAIIKEYAKLSPATINRDIIELVKLDLIVSKGNTYKGNIDKLRGSMPDKLTET